MTSASRRNTLKLGAAALVLGPSVMFSGTARASDDFKHKTGHKIGQFVVKVDGVFDEVPGVVSVDLGTITLFDPITFDPLKAPSYSGIAIGVADGKDAKGYPVKWEKISPLLGKGAAKKVAPTTALKLSVSLLAADGKTPAVTYHANNAVPVSIETDLDGVRMLRYAIDGMDIVTHDVPRHELKGAKFKAQIEGIGTMAGLAMTKAIYDWQELKGSELVIDGLDKASAATGPKFVSTTSLVTFVTGERPASALISKDKKIPSVGKVKFWATDGASPPSKDWRFTKAVLTSIELPKLQVGGDALVTETLNFKIESTKG